MKTQVQTKIQNNSNLTFVCKGCNAVNQYFTEVYRSHKRFADKMYMSFGTAVVLSTGAMMFINGGILIGCVAVYLMIK